MTPMNPDADIHLEAIAAGDADAFAAWVSTCESRLRASLMTFATVVDIEVIVQESLLRSWQAAPRISTANGRNALLRFALRVARNLAVSELRKQKARPEGHQVELEGEPMAVETSAAPRPGDPLLREHIAGCRDKLPKKPAAALEARLTAHGRRSDQELATDLGMTKNTFLQNFGRARRLLRACLERLGIVLEAELR